LLFEQLPPVNGCSVVTGLHRHDRSRVRHDRSRDIRDLAAAAGTWSRCWTRARACSCLTWRPTLGRRARWSAWQTCRRAGWSRAARMAQPRCAAGERCTWPPTRCAPPSPAHSARLWCRVSGNLSWLVVQGSDQAKPSSKLGCFVSSRAGTFRFWKCAGVHVIGTVCLAVGLPRGQRHARAEQCSRLSVCHLRRRTARQVESVLDTNGAGDTFATAYMLALARGALRPGQVANWAAARAVAQPQARRVDLGFKP
jgi:hypothetical protein